MNVSDFMLSIAKWTCSARRASPEGFWNMKTLELWNVIGMCVQINFNHSNYIRTYSI